MQEYTKAQSKSGIRKKGSKNFNESDVQALLDYVEEI